MHQIAIFNYSSCFIDIINVSAETWAKYSDDFDKLVFGVWGYRQEDVYYMTGENTITTRHLREEDLA